MKNRIILTNSTDPWHNLALEELLFENHEEGVNLFLWQNQNTVVIGRHQNAWKECRLELLEQDGGKLARRSSGGGAVFHDLGNLNFTFTTTKALYDQARQLGVIVEAVKRLGIEARFTGRNDIVTAAGAKFSGNAFRHSSTTDMHHGTILVGADMEKLGKYLMPSKEKLRAKGVDSVRSRVCNLIEYRSLTIEEVKTALVEAFEKEYGSWEWMQEKELPAKRLLKIREKHESWEWRCGVSPKFDLELSTRFVWGGVELGLFLENGRIKEAKVASDAMDEAFIERIPGILQGLPFQKEAVAGALFALGSEMGEDLGNWILEKEI